MDMGSYQVSGASLPRKPSILSRDLDGNEHLLSVTDHPAGLISIFDGEVVRFLSPSATAVLVMELIHAMGSYLPVRPGPISGACAGRPARPGAWEYRQKRAAGAERAAGGHVQGLPAKRSLDA
jgi:hypothetical protein